MKFFRINVGLLLAGLGLQVLSSTVFAATSYTVDVLGVYSDDVARLVSDPKALFVRNIEYANRALQNSGVNYRYNLVSVQKANWSGSGSIGSSQLESLTNNAAIQQLRDQYGADLVAALAPSTGGLCGIGWVPSADKSSQKFYSSAKKYGYSISGHGCGGKTMAHEMGHTMGLGHSYAQRSAGSLADWARGHGVNGSFVTIMAYESAYGVGYGSSGSLQIHSNPALNSCKSQPCGKPINQADGADASRALNLAAPQISQWYASTTGTTPTNSAPVAKNDSLTVDAGKSATINVLSNDYDPDNDSISIKSASTPSHGKAAVQTNATQIVYTADAGFSGSDSFSYTIVDIQGATASATVNVTVNGSSGGGTDDGGTSGGGTTGSNLLINGNVESGINGWSGAWGGQVSLSSDAHSGKNSIRGQGGYGFYARLKAPLSANRNYAVSGWLKPKYNSLAYVYLGVKQDGSWRYYYMTAFYLSAGKWTQFSQVRNIPGSQIQDAILLYQFPYGIPETVVADDAVVEVK